MSAAHQSDYWRFTDAIEAVYSYFKHHCGPESVVEHGPGLTWATRIEGLIPEDVWVQLEEHEKDAVIREVKGVRSCINEGYWTISSLPDPETAVHAYPVLHRLEAEYEGEVREQAHSSGPRQRYDPQGKPPLRDSANRIDWNRTPNLEAAFEQGWYKYKHLAGQRGRFENGVAVSIGRYILENTGYAIDRKDVMTHVNTYQGREARGEPVNPPKKTPLQYAMAPTAQQTFNPAFQTYASPQQYPFSTTVQPQHPVYATYPSSSYDPNLYQGYLGDEEDYHHAS
ncbi:hypothetical protein JCM8547_002000 [Rhodosporidiobolus lusitaniae]